MAIKLPNFNFFSRLDARSRVLFLVGVVVAAGFLVYLGLSYFSSEAATTGPSQVASAPGGLQSVPGGKLTPEYYRALSQANQQAAEQAQLSGGSAVPTLLNVPGEQALPIAQPASMGQCNIICPDETANVKYDLDDWVKQGKISPDTVTQLQQQADAHTSVEEYADTLSQMVKDGKLTPQQARELLERYKKQYKNVQLQNSANAMDSLIQAGKLPLGSANQLLTMQKDGTTLAAYSKQLDAMANSGAVTPPTAQQLLSQYTQQRAQELAQQNLAQLKSMTKAGEVTPDVEKTLADLQNKNVPVNQYAAELQKLVAEGKLTPAAAAKLLTAYKNQKLTLGPTASLDAICLEATTRMKDQISDLQKNGKITTDFATPLSDSVNKMTPLDAFQASLTNAVAEKKLASDGAQQLLGGYQIAYRICDETQRLKALQGDNAPLGNYVNELTQGVQKGALTPQQAASLAQDYQALVSPTAIATGTTAGTATTTVPGAAEFAALQQRVEQVGTTAAVQTVTATGGSTATFDAAAARAQEEADAERLDRLQALMGTMATQSQQLVSSWQPPTMAYREGSAASKSTEEKSTSTTTTTKGGYSSSGGPGALGSDAPIIKAGTILFGVLDTAVNSDYPDTPVMVSIVAGPYKGAKLLGKLKVAENVAGQLDRISLTFNLMNMDQWKKSVAINAFGIDPDTARTVMASQVDYHYLKRYGAMMSAAFLTGYAGALTSSGGTTTTGIFGTSTVNPQLSPAAKIAVGLGQVGTALGNAVQNYVNIPPTVKVDSGVGLGILFMADTTVAAT